MDYNIFYPIVTQNLLPVSKRKTGFLALFDILFHDTIAKWQSVWANNYLRGTDISNAWVIGSTYNYNDIVVGADNQVYQSLVASNTNHNPTTTTGYWWLVETNFVGVYERIAYNAQILTFEYALNKWFRTTFRQPPSLPDIYIVNNTITPNVFVVGGLESNSSTSYYYNFLNYQYVIDNMQVWASGTIYAANDIVVGSNGSVYQSIAGSNLNHNPTSTTGYWNFIRTSYFTQYNFTIWIPVAVWTALGSNATDRNNKVRSFADKYNVIGNQYNITTYP
jgi:hypothetical protein